MKLSALIEGLTILSKYCDDPDGYQTGAEHDAIYFYATAKPVSDEDVAKLKELGWLQDEVEETDDGNAPYDPEESWTAYT